MHTVQIIHTQTAEWEQNAFEPSLVKGWLMSCEQLKCENLERKEYIDNRLMEATLRLALEWISSC